MRAQAALTYRVRFYVYCAAESFNRLSDVGCLWLRIPAAQQSNIANAAEQSAHVDNLAPPAAYLRNRAFWEVQDVAAAEHLRRLVAAWPQLSCDKQLELIELAGAVAG